jgi:hypothetical protein
VALAAVGSASLLALGASTTRADTVSGLVQITCIPELHYFAIRRFSIENVTPTDGVGRGAADPRTAVTEQRYHVFDSLVLKRHPQECEMPAERSSDHHFYPEIHVRVTGQFDEHSEALSYRFIRDEAEVAYQGKIIATLGLNPYNLESGTESVEVAGNGLTVTIRTCGLTTSEEDTDNESIQCVSVDSPPVAPK